MKSIFKKILPAILLIWPYIIVIPFFVGSDNHTFSTYFNRIYMTLTVIIYVANILNACLSKGEEDYYKFAFWNMLIKLVHIPFYLAVFVIGLLMLITLVVPVMVLITPMVIFMLFVEDLFLMITSSMYGVNALIRASKQGVVSKQYALINGILHFFFVTDVISSICIFVKLKKCKEKQQKQIHS